MTTTIRKAAGVLKIGVPLGLAGLGIVLAQAHGGPWWVARTGSGWIGWPVSIFWEGVSVWLWWRTDATWPHRIGKYTATGALMAAMAAESAGPLLAAWAKTATAGGVLEVLAAQAALGFWVSPRALAAAGEVVGGSLPGWAILAMAVASAVFMPLVYGVALLCLTTVAREWRGAVAGEWLDLKSARGRSLWHGQPGDPPATAMAWVETVETRKRGNGNAETETSENWERMERLAEMREEIRRKIKPAPEGEGKSQADVAREWGWTPKEVTTVVNWPDGAANPGATGTARVYAKFKAAMERAKGGG